MPITKSAEKALRQNQRRKKQNTARKSSMRSAIKSFKNIVKSNNKEEMAKAIPGLYKTIDKMRKVKLIKPGKANRLKSQFAKKLGTMRKTGV
ncbi:30S ribosomal protein S20 [Candidatus Jorgensenbacteria bacterium RIFCSPHIGHO2_02_FULL_45_20]|uniref:Small ribosomal subunit protein bS20 n=2 Tax=Candidatus Joergenseniibacteriota TaxID=1752739 RepID=A0A1F6BQG7_9BACT|nr:MAG: 30S ribosomal protein S20 [Candidatus Jorgensenbacteria bacterium RIFCSPHIGHO2_02_FULL_45_20]